MEKLSASPQKAGLDAEKPRKKDIVWCWTLQTYAAKAAEDSNCRSKKNSCARLRLGRLEMRRENGGWRVIASLGQKNKCLSQSSAKGGPPKTHGRLNVRQSRAPGPQERRGELAIKIIRTHEGVIEV